MIEEIPQQEQRDLKIKSSLEVDIPEL